MAAFRLGVRRLQAGDAAAALQPHDLDADPPQRLVAELARHECIAGAWLARKRMAMAEQQVHYVLLLDWRGAVAGDAAGLTRVSAAIDLPGSHTVFTGSDAGRLALQAGSRRTWAPSWIARDCATVELPGVSVRVWLMRSSMRMRA